MFKYKITVFTPTYNRGYIIMKLYDSLKHQSFKDFEWIVIDDGSNDNTSEIFKNISNDKQEFEITYIKVKNGGKHRAINKGLELAQGELFFIVDSDDYLANDALEKIVNWEKTIKNKNEIVGLAGLRCYEDKSIIGSTFKGEYVDCTMLERNKYNISGDKAEVLYTNIFRKFLFPEIKNENFLSEAVVWNRISKENLKIRYINEKIYICEYLGDGLTNNFIKNLINNFEGYTLWVNEWNNLDIQGKQKFKNILLYCKLSRAKKMKSKEISSKLNMNLLKIYIINLLSILYYDFIKRNRILN